MNKIDKTKEPRLPQPVPHFNAQLSAIVEEARERVNSETPPPKPPREQAAWVTIANQAAEAMVAAAESAVTEAQNMLETTQRQADELRVEIEKREREIGELSDRIKKLGGDVL